MVEYMCDKCSYKTDRSDNLDRHKRLKHSNALKISCEKCSKLMTKEALKRHQKSRACNRSSIQRSSIEVLPSDNVISAKKVKIPPFTAEILELADGSTSIKHDRIVIDGTSFLLVPEIVAHEAFSSESPDSDTSLNALAPPSLPIQTFQTSDGFPNQTLNGE